MEGIIITTCGIKFTHTFAVVDFGRKTTYELILGRPFMRQSKLIQDWGKNHLYLKHTHALIRVNIVDHSYKDVKENPIDEYASITTHRSRVPADGSKHKNIFGCVELLTKVTLMKASVFIIEPWMTRNMSLNHSQKIYLSLYSGLMF